MIPNDALIKALRSLGYEHKGQTDRMTVWKKRGDTRRALVRRNTMHDEEYSRILLRQAGMPHADIERFIANVRENRKL